MKWFFFDCVFIGASWGLWDRGKGDWAAKVNDLCCCVCWERNHWCWLWDCRNSKVCWQYFQHNPSIFGWLFWWTWSHILSGIWILSTWWRMTFMGPGRESQDITAPYTKGPLTRGEMLTWILWVRECTFFYSNLPLFAFLSKCTSAHLCLVF